MVEIKENERGEKVQAELCARGKNVEKEKDVTWNLVKLSYGYMLFTILRTSTDAKVHHYNN